MSRVAKIPVVLGKGVEAKIENGFITVKGPKGTLSQKLNPGLSKLLSTTAKFISRPLSRQSSPTP